MKVNLTESAYGIKIVFDQIVNPLGDMWFSIFMIRLSVH